jgi:hypothetical protein
MAPTCDDGRRRRRWSRFLAFMCDAIKPRLLFGTGVELEVAPTSIELWLQRLGWFVPVGLSYYAVVRLYRYV